MELWSVIDEHDASELGALVSPTASFEEFYLVQKLMRALGSDNVDHRLRQIDFSGDDDAGLYPGTSLPIERFSDCSKILLVGSNIRKEQPLLGLRVRKAWRAGAKVAAINSMDWSLNFGLEAKTIVAPGLVPYALAQVLLLLCEMKNAEVPADISGDFLDGADEFSGHEECRKIAAMLCENTDDGVIVLGQSAISHPMFSCIEHLAQFIAEISGVALAILPPANSVAGWMAGCLPHRGANGVPVEASGLNARQMIHNPRAAYLLFILSLRETYPMACIPVRQWRMPVLWSVCSRLTTCPTTLMSFCQLPHLPKTLEHSSIAKVVCSTRLQLSNPWGSRARGGKFFGCWVISLIYPDLTTFKSAMYLKKLLPRQKTLVSPMDRAAVQYLAYKRSQGFPLDTLS